MKNFKFDLQRFSEGAVSGAASSPAAVSSGSATGNQDPTAKTNGSTDGQSANGNIADRKSEYERLKAEYKDFYDKDVQTHVKNRHKDYGILKADKDAQDEFLSTLHTKYGTKDLAGLKEAIDADEGFWRDQADKEDMTVEQYKERLRLKSELATANGKLHEIDLEKQAQEQYNKWYEEAKEIKEKYPDMNFDLNAELKNPRFRSMISAQYSQEYMPSMLEIFEIIHHNEIIEREKAAVQKSTIDNIKARGLRPDEAGSSSNGAVSYGKNVSNLSKKERAELAEKAMRGERVTF